MASPIPTAFQFFLDQGWTPAQSAGIVSNLWNESRLNPNGPRGDGGLARGLAQWHPDRHANLVRYAAASGGDPTDLMTQLGFVHWELTNTEKGAGERLKGARSAADAASIFDRLYERSAGLSRDRRMKDAESILSGTPVDWTAGPGGAPIHAPATAPGPPNPSSPTMLAKLFGGAPKPPNAKKDRLAALFADASMPASQPIQFAPLMKRGPAQVGMTPQQSLSPYGIRALMQG